MITLEPMVPGADILFGIDLAGMIPATRTLSSAAITERQGADLAAITATVTGTRALVRIVASAPGAIVFDLIGTFSDGTKDGPQINLRIL